MSAQFLTAVAAADPATPLVGDLTGPDVIAEVDRTVGVLASAGVAAGETVGLWAGNTAQWVIGLLATLEVGARPLLLADDSPASEVERLLSAAGGRRYLTVDSGSIAGGGLTLVGAPGEPSGTPAVVLLASSGSTDAPKIVHRSVASLVAEGRRFVSAGYVTASDTLLLPLPMSHAYALGWVAGSLLAGAGLRPVAPQAFGAVRDALADGATVMATVPGLARLLLSRLTSRSAAHPAPALRLVMAGAGYVDADLDERWSAGLGVGLSRNYGSTETGAVLAGPAGMPSGFVGVPMPGVTVTLRDDDDAVVDGPGVGQIVVGLEDGTVHEMGDLAQRDDEGRLQIIGRRRTGAVRRGARWVSTLEVSSVLSRAYGVADVVVSGRRAAAADDESLVAEYVPAGRDVTPATLAAYARANLAPYKVPNVFQPRTRLRRNSLGKSQHGVEMRLTSEAVALDAVRAYRRTELLLTFAELGALPALADGVSAVDLGERLGLDAEVVGDLLAAARELGLLTLATATKPFDATELETTIRAERAIRDGLTYDRLVAAARPALRAKTGPAETAPAGSGPAETVLAETELAETVSGGDRVAHLCDLAGVDPDQRWLEVGPMATAVDAAATVYDACFVVDAVHGPGAGADLVWLAERLRPGGRLVIEDRFVDAPGGSDPTIELSWLAAGGRAWWRLADLQPGLESVGFRIMSVTPAPESGGTVLLARLGET